MKGKIKKMAVGVGAVLILIGGRVVFSEAGSQSDPLVTFSYVEKKFEEIKEYVNEKIGEPQNNSVKQSAWQIVDILEGQSLIGKDGTEIILRSGNCITISNISKITQNGVEFTIDNGLTDITDGRDLKMGENIPRDHLLIIPRDDGRGANCSSNSIFLVKGDYTIK